MPQAFKGTLKAFDVARAMAVGVRQALPKAKVAVLPMADGGDDTLNVLVEATRGHYRSAEVTGPTGLPVNARWGVLGDGETAAIEMAEASGIRLITHAQRDPLNSSTIGTGQLIRASLDEGFRKIILGVGGSATVDAGTGAARALGACFSDAAGQDLPSGGAALARLESIDLSSLDPRLGDCDIRIACDVDIPLCGPRGAWRFAAQKGAGPEQQEQLARAMERFGSVVAESRGVDLRDMSLAGPAGGLSGGLHALIGAVLVSGPDLVLEAAGMEGRISQVDLIVIGEGRMDANTFWGKGPAALAARARRAGVPAVAVVGQLGADTPNLLEKGILDVETLLSHASSEQDALDCPEPLISAATREVVGRYVRSRAATERR